MNRATSPASLVFPVLIFTIAALILTVGGSAMSLEQQGDAIVQLPDPSLQGSVSLEELLASRRSVRQYGHRALSLEEVSQVLWAAQGITSESGFRTAPSAGALYPLVLYLVAENVEGLPDGVWEYSPEGLSLELVMEGTLLADLSDAALGQSSVASAAAVIAITAIPEITEARYADRSMRYIDQEVGCVCQNVYLQCEALGLGTVAIGAFRDDTVADVLATDAAPRLLMPIGPMP